VKEDTSAVPIRILDKEYRVACSPEEQPALDASARLVDQKMREIRATGKVIGSDRIAVMAALNIAHELLQAQSAQDFTAQNINRRIRLLQEKIEGALHAGKELEL
jgi:cell division protein ZapA